MTKNINFNARSIIEKVQQEHGMTYREMAEKCNVATGSIQRWYTMGRARESRIKPLIDLISSTRLSVENICETLIDIYRNHRKPFTLTHSQLAKICGRSRLSSSLVKKIANELDNLGFSLVQNIDSDDDTIIYSIYRTKWLLKRAEILDYRYLREYYTNKYEEELEIEEEID